MVSSANKNQAIEFASILNKNRGTYTFSDENGEFNISGVLGDSLEIKHISYKPYQGLLTTNISFELDPNFNELPEIIISRNNKPVIKNNINTKNSSVYGLGLDRIYAFKIKNEIKSKAISIKIPIKFKRNFSSEGKIIIQFLKNISDSISEPLSKQYAIELSEIEGLKFINLNFDKDNIIFPNQYFFITIQRIVLNKVFNKNKSLSVNPFFYYEESNKEHVFYVKSIFKSKWFELNRTNHLFTPELQMKLISEKLY
tara:strand:+ start:521 stop:1288 length:768 start_codon:yes stop_codon:yes gene_type:complete